MFAEWLAGQEGVSLTAEAEHGRQLLHKTCAKGRLEVAVWLAEQGRVSMTAWDKDDSTPLQLAASYGHTQVAEVLKAFGRK